MHEGIACPDSRLGRVCAARPVSGGWPAPSIPATWHRRGRQLQVAPAEERETGCSGETSAPDTEVRLEPGELGTLPQDVDGARHCCLLRFRLTWPASQMYQSLSEMEGGTITA